MAECKMVAKEKRMADRTPWTALAIIGSYTLMKSEGFKAQRLVRVINAINDMEAKFDRGEITVEKMSQRLMDKADWTIECREYEESEIKAKKGTYRHWIDAKQIPAQNSINRQATRYLIFLFSALMEEYGYGKDRLTRVQTAINDLLESYRTNRTTVALWRMELMNETGLVFEQPIDPLTQDNKSVMV